MSAWEIIGFIAIIVVLILAIWLLNRSEKRTKTKWKLDAYRLLEEKNPDPKNVREAIKFIRIYQGRIRKDPEFTQLDKMLCGLLYEIEPIEDKQEKKVKK